MRILLDTNIVIDLESFKGPVSENFAEFAKLANQHAHQLLVHPASIEDLMRDQDSSRRESNLSKTKKYQALDRPPLPSAQELQTFGLTESSDNDRVDNKILWALKQDAVALLVTEDKRIHSKAEHLSLGDRVHYLDEVVESLRQLHAKIHVQLPAVDEAPLHSISVEIPFFDSLRQDYARFNDWYKKSSREGRRTWVCFERDNVPGAICIYKEEADQTVTKDCVLPGKILKLCTFKVAEHFRGKKTGELLLKMAFSFATRNSLAYVYVTVKPDRHERLEELFKDFGFDEVGVNGGGDKVFVKNHPASPPSSALLPLPYHVSFSPHISVRPNDSAFIIPIQPQFHEILFPEQQEQKSFRFLPNISAGNAIKRAYLCHARLNSLEPGNILFFYRSKDIRKITSMGVLESVDRSIDADKIAEIVSKRTVYSYDEIKEMAKGKKVMALLFRLAHHLSEPIESSELERAGIKSPIQTIRRIDYGTFKALIAPRPEIGCFFPNQTEIRV
jgi:hypothetical protein